MTRIIESYHTHAEGRHMGWWGTITHPAHFDENFKEIKNSSWSEEIHNATTLENALCLRKIVMAKIGAGLLFGHENIG